MNEITEGKFPEVRSRQEMYLQDIIKSLSNESISDNNYPDPLSRQEAYLQIIISKLRANDPNIEINTEDIEKAVNKYLEQNPIQPGATENQAQQIEQNKNDITSLKEDIEKLNDTVDGKKTIIEQDAISLISTIENDNGVVIKGRVKNGIVSSDGNNTLYCYYLNNGGLFKAENLSSDNWNSSRCWAAFSGKNGTADEFIEEYSDKSTSKQRVNVSTEGYIEFPSTVKMVVFAHFDNDTTNVITIKKKITNREGGIASKIIDIENQITEDKEDNNITEINRKYSFGYVDLTKVKIDEPTDTSTIENSILYPVLVNNKSNGDISDTFRYSCPMKVASSEYPNYKAVTMGDKRKGGYCVEFYVDDDFEIITYNSVRVTIVMDNTLVSDGISKNTSYPNCHTKISFKEHEKHLIRLFFDGSIIFFGVKSKGTVLKYESVRMRMIADGDSIVEGVAVIGCYGVYGCMMSIISQILNMDFINAGVGGSGYLRTGNAGQPNMPDRFDSYITPLTPKLLIVMAGLNDSGEDIETVKTQIDVYWAKVKALNPKYVIMISPYSPIPTPSSGNIAIASYLKEVAEKYMYPYIDTINGKTYDSMGNIVTEYSYGGLTTDKHRTEWYSEYLNGSGGDTTHPNKIGHKWMGQYLANEIFKICKDDFGLIN